MADLRSAIATLAEDFASSVVAALRGASLDEISELAGGAVARPSVRGKRATTSPRTTAAAPSTAAARLPRLGKGGKQRSAADFETIVGAIVTLLQQHTEGLRAEQIQKELGLSKKDTPRPLLLALGAKKIRKKGERRSTTYFAA
ncbi:MAG: hypothetical protein ACXWVM_32005 [Polyangiales bacterium]